MAPILTSAAGHLVFGNVPKSQGDPLSLKFSVFRGGDPLPFKLSVETQTDDIWVFRISLPEGLKLGDGPSIVVKYAGTDHLVDTGPDLLGFVNDINEPSGGHLMGHPLFYSLIEKMPWRFDVPQHMIDHVAGSGTQESFRRLGYSTALDILRFGVIKSSSDKIFDLGCGCGRMGLMLSALLDPSKGGWYTGFDIWRDGIDWARENVVPIRPNTTFKTLGEHNEYNATASYRIDLPDSSQDAFVSTSVFTHLRKDYADHYTKEIGRILKQGGRGYITFFASKDVWRSWNMGVNPEEDDYGINYVNVQAEDTFVEERQAVDMLERHGLKVTGVKYGSWRGGRHYRSVMGHQDVFIVRRL